MALVMVLSVAVPQDGHAQGTAQVVVSGVPGVLPSPFRDALERNYRQGRYMMQFTYTGQGPAQFRFRVTLEKGGQELVETTSEPTRFEPGTYTYRTFDDPPEIHFPVGMEELIDQLPSEVQRSVVQAGTLPEGDYLLQIEPVPEEPTVAATPGMAPFQVILPDPPALVTPADGANVTVPVPTFTWTPVAGAAAGAQLEYEVLLVEMLPEQTPLQAIRANRAHYQNTFSNRTSFSYTPELLPLEEGRRYTWRVRATGTLDGRELPFSDEGESEIHTFTYRTVTGGHEAPQLVAPVSDEPVPGLDVLRFRWRTATGPAADDHDGYRRIYQRILVKPRDGRGAEAAMETNQVLLDRTYPFRAESQHDRPYPADAESLPDGDYVWGVRIVGETAGGDEEVLARSRVAAFTVGAVEEEAVPPVAGGVIRLTRFAAVVGTDELDRAGGRYDGQAQLALDLVGQPQPVRVSAHVTELQADTDEAGVLVAQSGRVLSNRLPSASPIADIPGMRVEALRWDDEAGTVNVDARLVPAGPFGCADPAVDLPANALSLLPDGLVQGTVSVDVSCPIEVGPFRATPTNATLRFGRDGNTQTARFESEARLEVSSEVDATGTLALDLTTGQFQELSFEIDEPFEWNVPVDDPALTFRVNHAVVNLDGLTIDGRNRLLLPEGNHVGATFDRLVVGFGRPGIQSGRVVFDEAFAFEAGMDQAGGNLRYRAVPTGAELANSPGVLFALAGTTVLDRTGLHSSGSATAQLSFGDWMPSQSLQADFSSDFAVGFDPFGIHRGQVDLSYEGTSIGYVDAEGFHPDPSQQVVQLPERLPLPNEQVAYLRLKRDGTPLVTLTHESGGTALIETKSGESLDLVIPALQGQPTLSAQIEDLRVQTRGGFSYQSGTVTATVSGGPIDLTQDGVPLYLARAGFGPVDVGGTSRTGLFLKGNLSLFGQDVGQEGEITLAVNEAGGISGAIDLPNLNEQIALAGGGKAALTIESVSGSIEAPASGAPTYDLDLSSAFVLQDGETTLASADLALRLTERDLSVEQFAASSDLQTPPLQAGGFGLNIGGVSSLKDFTYSQQDGFGFGLGLDLTIQLAMPAGRTFTVPLKGVEIFRDAPTGEAGIEIPGQTIHAGTKPSLDDEQTLAVGPVDLRLFNVELTQDVTFDWFNAPQSLGQALRALKLDLALTINAFPELGGREISVYGAGFEDGVFTGRLDASSFQPGDQPTISLGGTAGITIEEISGALTDDGTAQNPQQGFDIDLAGQLQLPEAFSEAGTPDCPPMDVSAGLTSGGGLQGSISNFAACGNMQFGPATLTFPSSTLQLASQNGTQSAMLDGQAKATIEGANDNTLSATGTARLDLITGELLSASIAFTGAFDYGVPQSNPLFVFRVQQATLSAAGLTLTGNGSLRTEQDQDIAGVAFDQFTVHPDSGIVSGSATLQSQFGLDISLPSGANWTVIEPSAPTPTSAALRLTVPARLTLDADGLLVGGSSTASLNFNGETHASLAADFERFRLGLTPIAVENGRIDLMLQDDTRVAYYDADGIHPDGGGLVATSVPEKLPLPSSQIAYLQLRDDDGNALVDYESVQGGFELTSRTQNDAPQPVELHLVAIESGGTHPTFDITIPKSRPLIVQGQQVQSGRIAVFVDEPLQTDYDLPLRFDSLVYERSQQGGYALTADGNVILPEGLGGEDVRFRDLGFGTGGPRGTVEAGIYEGSETGTGTCTGLPSDMPEDPLASVAYTNASLRTDVQPEDADLGLRLQGVELHFDADGHSFAVAGDVTSRLLRNPNAPEELPDDIAFTADYDGSTWTTSLCTGLLPADENGDKKVTLQLAELYLNEGTGAGIGLEIGQNTTNLILSGTARFPDVLGGSFAATVEDLKMGTVGVDVGKVQGGTGGQEFTLFDGEVKVETDPPPQGFGVDWDTSKEVLVLSMSGNLWLTSFLCDGEPTQCNGRDAVRIEDFSVDTRGEVGLGSASGNLLSGRAEPLVVIDNTPDPTLTLDELRLTKPAGEAMLALRIGGAINLPDLMDGVSSDFGATIDSEGRITPDSPLSACFVESCSSGNPFDEIGDNTPEDTEVDFGDVATLDVKEAGVDFNGGYLSQPAVYANGAAYIQPENDQVGDLVRFGTLGNKDKGSAGLYVGLTSNGQTETKVNAAAHIDDFDLFGFLTLRNLEVSIDRTGSAPKFVLTRGDIDPNLDGLGADVSVGWTDLTISRANGVEKWGRPDGRFELTVLGFASLSMEGLSFGSGAFTHGDSTVVADKHFALQGAELSVGDDLLKGEVEAAYYYVTDGGEKAIEIYGLEVPLSELGRAEATFVYHKSGGAMELYAAGAATVMGTSVSVTGAFANDGNGKVRYGLAVTARITGTGIPVAPGVFVNGLGGGFFYRPKAEWVRAEKDNVFTDSADMLPEKPRSSVQGLKFAAYLYGSAVVGQVDAEVLLEATDSNVSLYGVGGLVGMREMVEVGMRLTVYYDERAGVDGGAVVDVFNPPVLDGEANVNFAAYAQGNGGGSDVMWFIKGNADFTVQLIYNASGSFMASNAGMLLKEMRLEIGTPDLGIVKINAGAVASFWVVPNESLGAYAKIYVDASLFAGAAKLGANLKGAYIREDALIYVAAEAYVKVVGVFNGNVGLWAAVERRNLKGGKGTNARYERMVAGARRQAEQMIAQAQQAAKKMEELQSAPVPVSDEALREAGMNAIHPEPPTLDGGRSEVQSIFSDLESAKQEALDQAPVDVAWDQTDLKWGQIHLVEANDKPSPAQANQARQRAEDRREEANRQVQAVIDHLNSLEAKQIEWNNEASEILARMDRSSPVGNVREADTTESGRVVRSPSWSIEEGKANQQAQDLKALKESIDELDQQYRESIAAVEANLTQANQLFDATITFPGDESSGSTGQGETSIDELAGIYAEQAELTRKYYASRADYLWSLGGWAAAENAMLHGQESAIDQTLADGGPTAKVSVAGLVESEVEMEATLRKLTVSWYDAFKKLAPEHGPDMSAQQFEGRLDGAVRETLLSRFETWGKRLWYETFDHGLVAIEKEAESEARVLGRDMRGALGGEAYAEFTRRVDDAYVAKHQLLTTYYGMVESYRGWREDTGLEEDVQMGGDRSTLHLSQDRVLDIKLGMVEGLLEPPQITGVSVDREHDGWKARADFTVSANHPDGLSEVSYRVQRGMDSNVHSSGDFYSLGERDAFTIYAFAEQRSQQTQDFRVTVRARGPGGATLTRQASVTLAVNGDGEDAAPDGTVADAIEEDHTPPEQLSLSFERLDVDTQWEERQVGSGQDGQQAGGNGNTVSIGNLEQTGRVQSVRVQVERRWTSSPSVLRMEMKAEDPESDIAGFDYRIGTSKGGGEVRDWTPAQGRSETRDIQSSQREPAAVTLHAVVRGLSLEEGTPYYVSVRARNGEGLETVHEEDIPLVYDGTPPADPGRADDEVDEGSEPAPRPVTARYGTVTSPPSRAGASTDAGDPATPAITVQWKPASDDGSGLRDYYEYVVTRDNPDQPFATFDGGNRFAHASNGTTVTISNDQLDYPDIASDLLSYTDSAWVHVRAVDNAGNPGEALTIGPVVARDPSMPTLPEVRPMVVEDGVRLYLVEPAHDPESDVRGYQYEIRHAETGQTLKSYPSDSSLDIGVGCMRMREMLDPTQLDFDLSEAMAAPIEWQGCPDVSGFSAGTYAGFGSGYGQGSGSESQESESDAPSTAPYVHISNGSLPIGEPLEIHLTAVNGQGFSDQGAQTGGVGPVITGPVLLDGSAPTVSASATSGSDGSDVSVTIHEAHDPETGIAHVEYGRGFNQWTEVAAPGDRPTTPKSYSFSPSGLITANSEGPRTVTLRVTNGAGQQTVKTVKVNTGVSGGQDDGTNWSSGGTQDWSF